MRTLAFASLAALAALAAAPAMAQAADSYAFCYADPPTYRSGTLVYTQVRFVGAGAIDLFEVGNALVETSRQVQGRQPSCWRYPNEQVAEAKRQEGMARDRARGYTVLESPWQPSRISNVPVSIPVAPPPPASPAAAGGPPTIIASPVPDAPAQPTPALPPVSGASPAPAASVTADIDRALDAQQAAAKPAPPAPPVPDPQAGAVANLNAGVVAAEAARLNAAAQVQADYQRQLAEHARQVEAIRAANAKAQADYQAAVKACAAGDFSKCGGPPVPVKQD